MPFLMPASLTASHRWAGVTRYAGDGLRLMGSTGTLKNFHATPEPHTNCPAIQGEPTSEQPGLP